MSAFTPRTPPRSLDNENPVVGDFTGNIIGIISIISISIISMSISISIRMVWYGMVWVATLLDPDLGQVATGGGS